MSFAAVWEKIERLAGETFYELGGKTFTYQADGEALRPDADEMTIARSEFERAHGLGACPPPRQLKAMGFGTREASYIFSILTDPRLRDS